MASEGALNVSMEEVMDQGDLSDAEDAEKLDLSPFKVDWLDLEFAGCPQPLGISSLPGCRYQKNWRSLVYDIGCLKSESIEDVFCFCTKGEFHRYRVPQLLEKYQEAGFTVHHHPIEDGQVPMFEDLMKLVEEIRLCLMGGRKTLVHCYGGLGRSVVVAACVMMVMDENIDHEEAARKLKALRGDAAIQSVKQYNFMNDFQDLLKKYREDSTGSDSRSRSISR